jgi:hypothetical protein
VQLSNRRNVWPESAVRAYLGTVAAAQATPVIDGILIQLTHDDTAPRIAAWARRLLERGERAKVGGDDEPTTQRAG